MSSLPPAIAAQYLGIATDNEAAPDTPAEHPARTVQMEKLRSDADALLRHLGLGSVDRKQSGE